MNRKEIARREKREKNSTNQPRSRKYNHFNIGRLPLPPPGFPRINAKWLSSLGEETVMEDMKLRLADLVDAQRKGPHLPTIVVTLERRIWEPLWSSKENPDLPHFAVCYGMANSFFNDRSIYSRSCAVKYLLVGDRKVIQVGWFVALLQMPMNMSGIQVVKTKNPSYWPRVLQLTSYTVRLLRTDLWSQTLMLAPFQRVRQLTPELMTRRRTWRRRGNL